jgi:hypothetical protein
MLSFIHTKGRIIALYSECPFAECHYSQNNGRLLLCRVLFMLSFIHAKCHIIALYAECHYAECHYAECHYAECRGTEIDDTLIKITRLF